MAAKKEKLAEKIDAQLVCAICHCRYKTPKVLPCLHSFCRDCLDRHIGIEKTKSLSSHRETDAPANPALKVRIHCPLCRNESDLPTSGVDGYTTNFTLSNLVEVLDIHDDEGEDAQFICGNGLDENPAVVHCLDCQCYLCENCLDLHKKVKATKNHQVVSIEEIKKDVRKLEQKRYCIEHEGEELKLYCKTCQEVICRDCTIVTHKQHDYTFIKAVKEELVKEMSDLVEVVRGKEELFVGHRGYLEQVRYQSQENIDSCKRRVEEFFEGWKRRLEDRKQELLQQLGQDFGEVSKRLGGENDAVELMIAQIQSAIGFTRRLLDRGTPCDIAMMSKTACKQLNLVKMVEWDPDSVRPCKFSFVGHENNPVNATVRGGIHRDEIIVEGLRQPTLGENEFTIRVLGEVETEVVVVSVEAANGERLGNTHVKAKGNHEWTAYYNIPRDGVYKISVSVDGVEAKGGPFERIWQSRLNKGMNVRRGQDWKWGDQDGGPLAVGQVIGFATDVGASDNWVKIKWANGRQNNYRWGAEGAFDLEIVN